MPCVHRALALKVFPPYVATLMVVVSSLIKQSFPGRGRRLCSAVIYANMQDMTAV